MKEPKSIRYFLAPHEGERSAAASRTALTAALCELFAYTADKRTARSLGAATLPLEELAATAPERAAAFSASCEKRRTLGSLFYADAADALGEGELLVRAMLLSEAHSAEAPFAVASSMPAVLPQLLCHFGQTSLFVALDRARIKAPVCSENTVSYEWKSPDGSSCRLLIPTRVERDALHPTLYTAHFAEGDAAAYQGELLLDRANADDALAAENRRAADMLLYQLEPLAALLSLSDKRRDLRPALNRMARTLLKNMTVTDTVRLSPAVYRHRLDRAAMLCEEGKELLTSLMREFAPARLNEGEAAALLLFSPYQEVTPVCATVHLTLATDREFTFTTAEGYELAYQILKKREEGGAFSYKIRLLHPKLAPLAVTRISVVYGTPCVAKSAKKQSMRIENEGFCCEVSEGRLRVTCKNTGRVLLNPFFLEDQGDRGQTAFRAAQEGSLLFFPDNWHLTEDSLLPTLEADVPLDLPRFYDREADERSAESLHTVAHLTLVAEPHSERLRISVSYTDAANDHRLRLAVRTELTNSQLATDTPFSYRMSQKSGTVVDYFAHLFQEDAAFALLLDARRALECVNDTLYVTLSHSGAYRTDVTPNAALSLSLVSRRALTHGELRRMSLAHRLAPVSLAISFDDRSDAREGIPPRYTALPFSVQDGHALITAVRRREGGEGVVLHLLNTEREACELQLASGVPTALSTLAEQEEIPLSLGGRVKITLAPEQIVALILQPPRGI